MRINRTGDDASWTDGDQFEYFKEKKRYNDIMNLDRQGYADYLKRYDVPVWSALNAQCLFEDGVSWKPEETPAPQIAINCGTRGIETKSEHQRTSRSFSRDSLETKKNNAAKPKQAEVKGLAAWAKS